MLTKTSAIDEYWSSVQLVSLNLKLEMTFSVSKSEIGWFKVLIITSDIVRHCFFYYK